jgi:hypothetical protein
VSIVNRRNAVMGWVTWEVGKRLIVYKAKHAAPKVDSDGRMPNKSAIALFAATVGGVVFFLRRRAGGDDEDAAES